MADVKQIINQRTRNESNAFIKISGNYTRYINLNVGAVSLLGDKTKRVDLYIDEYKNCILIVPNNKNGQYSLSRKRGNCGSISFQFAYTQIPQIDTGKRYKVQKEKEGILFFFEKVGEQSGRCEMDKDNNRCV